MKFILIQQAPPEKPGRGRCDSAGFEKLAAAERLGGAAPFEARRGDASRWRVVTGAGRRGRETAEGLFTLSEPPEETGLLADAPLRPFRETKRRLPLWLWRWMAVLLWFFGEGRNEALNRAGRLLDSLEAEGRDCVIIAGGLTLAALKTALRRRGYELEGGGLFPRPLDRVRAAKNVPRCGGCKHNCRLTEPKCHVGRSKAAERGIPIQ